MGRYVPAGSHVNFLDLEKDFERANTWKTVFGGWLLLTT